MTISDRIKLPFGSRSVRFLYSTTNNRTFVDVINQSTSAGTSHPTPRVSVLTESTAEASKSETSNVSEEKESATEGCGCKDTEPCQ